MILKDNSDKRLIIYSEEAKVEDLPKQKIPYFKHKYQFKNTTYGKGYFNRFEIWKGNRFGAIEQQFNDFRVFFMVTSPGGEIIEEYYTEFDDATHKIKQLMR